MKIDPAQLEATIREVLAAMLPGNDNQTEAPAKQQEAPGDGVFADMNSMTNWEEWLFLFLLS